MKYNYCYVVPFLHFYDVWLKDKVSMVQQSQETCSLVSPLPQLTMHPEQITYSFFICEIKSD